MRLLSVLGLLLTNVVYVRSHGYQELWFTTHVDHFSFANNDEFEMRYLVNDSWWNDDAGPIFIYLGNEADIVFFWDNTGFMFDIAGEFSALIVFAEHRYYGKSHPYPGSSWDDLSRTGYLTSEQALADFADLLTHLRNTLPGAADSPAIAFGGSYGGMLAAWIRIKYPHVVQGAIASSAPILQFTGLTPCQAFGEVVTRTFQRSGDHCSSVIRKSWQAIDRVLSDPDSLAWLNDAWHICKPLRNASQAAELKSWLMDLYTTMAVVDYPYPSGFIAPLPAFPVQVACSFLHDDHGDDDQSLLLNLYSVINLFFNYTGVVPCIATRGQGYNLFIDGWNFQTCTEMVIPMCYNGVDDMFEPAIWNYTEYAAKCFNKYHVQPRPYMTQLMYGGRNITSASNIVFSNGLMDPWSSGGILTSYSDSLVEVVIPNVAHHLDLRSSDPADPPDVIQARNKERHFIALWIAQHKKTLVRNSINAAN